ncbi:unnamed protein product [Spirodela intermedia]|uniref:Response regulatory domain-containing protein n=1 Tax=Spirodela intermedia TaxID=51605 RepID=A0A7I8KHG9_SPIIN|nr:unnamed protein product [Spirodela intermedia]
MGLEDGGSAAGAGEGGGGEGERFRVLVVDDSPVDRKIVERLLLRSGNLFEVIAVDGGKKAIEVLGLNYADCSVDLILTDYCMPEMNGYELLKAVKEHKLRKSIPVVLMSSENNPQRMTRCQAMGAEDFILKPLKAVDVQQLRHYTRPAAAAAVAMEAESAAKADGKRKLPPMKVVGENKGSERQPRPRLARVAVS